MQEFFKLLLDHYYISIRGTETFLQMNCEVN